MHSREVTITTSKNQVARVTKIASNDLVFLKPCHHRSCAADVGVSFDCWNQQLFKGLVLICVVKLSYCFADVLAYFARINVELSPTANSISDHDHFLVLAYEPRILATFVSLVKFRIISHSRQKVRKAVTGFCLSISLALMVSDQCCSWKTAYQV